ncbi:MAG TPA: FlgD immunoglobulin-like domain containing protein [Terriglobales bacterium]|nr:FlgD immunoglobulin-like domain containing protein [Terriglobales bacterium]
MKKISLTFFLILLLLSASTAWSAKVSKSSYYQTLLESRANLESSGFTPLKILQQRLNQDEFVYNLAGAGIKRGLSVTTPGIISLLGDFRVNEENYSATFSQRMPDIALFKDGSFVSVWQDERNGDWDLYSQKINSSGAVIGSSLKIVADARHTDQIEPSITRTLDSNLVLVWVDGAELNIYGQRYAPNLSTVGDTFRINDSNIPNSSFEPNVKSFTDESFVAAWVDVSSGNNLFARRYDSSGSPLGPSFKVNSVSGIAPPKAPSVSFDQNGRFVIAWEDYRNLDADIYFQRYDSSGAAAGSNVLANIDLSSEDQYSPSVAKRSNGDFMITWVDTRGGKVNIFARLFDSAGNAKTSFFMVNSDTDSAQHWEPKIDSDTMRNYTIVWGDYRNEPAIFFQKYDSTGTSIGTNTKLSENGVQGFKDNPALSIRENGDFVSVWSDHRSKSYDIYSQRVISGTLSGTNFRLNDDSIGAIQNEPAIAKDPDKNFILAWTDYRNGNRDIYLKKFTRFSDLVFSDRRVDTNNFSASCAQPDVAADGSKNILAVWQDFRSGLNIFAQRFDPSGNPIDTNFQVNNSTTLNNSPACSKAFDGKSIVTWSATQSGVKNIYARIFNSNGVPSDTNFKVNDDGQAVDHLNPKAGMDSTGNFTIAWYDKRNSLEKIYLQRYNSAGGKIGSNFASYSDSVNAVQREFDLGVNTKGNMVLAWTQLDGEITNLYAQRYSSAGAPLGNNFLVNDPAGIPAEPSVSIDDDTFFIVVWTDYRSGGPQIYSQVYYFNEGIPSGGNSLVDNDATNALHFDPDVALSPPNIYTAWVDNRIPGDGFDIFSNAIKYRQTGIKEDQVNLPVTFDLKQNYPNPFNPSTTISFTVDGSRFVVHNPVPTTLTIYNIRGERVRTLLDDFRSPGNYKIIWDGKDDAGKKVASGVYFYRLKVGENSISKRMVLLK